MVVSEQVETGPVDQGTGADVVAGGVDVVVRVDVQVVVRDDVAMHRYEGRVGGELAALAVYSRAERFLIFSHTEVLPGYEGRGVASELIRQALDDVRS